MTALKKIALFDLDHTLIPIDSDYEWGEFTIALGWCDGAGVIAICPEPDSPSVDGNCDHATADSTGRLD